MPLHDYECGKHGVREFVVAWDEYTVPCPDCDAPMPRVYTRPVQRGGSWIPRGGYYDKGLGENITSVEQWRQVQKDRHLEAIGEGRQV